ncbi:GTPase activation, GAP [Venustampulla echinocandica]|uniref:GTPase activation, GAP n=1 Tax=Venustampulla echinocandica TaxID=2656787 RepID=A0A370U0F3_9HELO|nr:GTPase activation, GAP [Venustampulla echinocandica]RDL41245.1 GTPase activation, GAP [Venustampulla echinocandica]
MASNLPPPSSSQQPFATPQPAPVQPTSPPTKQNLKSWWAGFRKEGKKSDTHGINPTSSSCLLPSEQGQAASGSPDELSVLRWGEQKRSPFARGIKGYCTGFIEESVDSIRAVSRSFPGDQSIDLEPASELRLSFQDSIFEVAIADEPQVKKRSSTVVSQSSLVRHVRRKRPASVAVGADNPMTKLEQMMMSVPLAGHSYYESSDALAILTAPAPRSNPISHMFSLMKSSLRTSAPFPCPTNPPPEVELEYAKLTCQTDLAPGIFGIPLRQSITYANVAISLVDADGKSYIYGYVPIVVAKCGVYLKEKATNVEGIFRLSGSEKRIKELKTIFDSPDRYGKGLDWAGYTVHDAANVLRRYLNQLPEPIVPLDLYDRFRNPLQGHTMQAVGDTEGTQLADTFNMEEAIETYQKLITELPPLNRQLLLYILDLLAVFASKSDDNRMNAQNLAAIFQPGMLSHPSHDMAPSEYRLSQDVLIFLIENQDHFLIGMRGTAADEQTVNEVQSGGSPRPGTPSTPGKKNTIRRSTSTASAGADSIRKYGGIRRNVSVSSRNSRQSTGGPSPASPALAHTASAGVHRSNTLPSKRSPGLPSNRVAKGSGSPSPTAAVFVSNQTSRLAAPSSPGLQAGIPGKSSLAPSSHTESAVASQERLLGDRSEKQPEVVTPSKERNMPNFFRSTTSESERKQPNKLRKKQRVASSSNPSAQSSSQSLHAPPQDSVTSVPPALQSSQGTQDATALPVLESIPSENAHNISDSTPPLTQTPRAEAQGQQLVETEGPGQPSEQALKPGTPPASIHSHSSLNDQSDLDHIDDSAPGAEQREKRSRWRLSRHRDTSQSLGYSLSPRKGLGSDGGAGASSSSVGSASRPRKNSTGDTMPVASESTLVSAHPHSSNESGPGSSAGSEDKKGPLGWIKNKMREKREESKEKEAEKERNKSPPATTDRLTSILPGRGKSVDITREERNKSPPATTDRLASILPGRGKSVDITREVLPEKVPEESSVPRQPQESQQQ